MGVTAYDIKKALSIRHSADFFTTECMSGPAGRGTFRFDAVAITKSWTKPTFIGYEVKVSRSDFKADNKFYAYLPYFHELYIACPKGMINREELPESIGLVWYNPETKEIRAKKRAPYRDIEIDVEMLLHIFYSHLKSDRTPFFADRASFCKQYLSDKHSFYCIGRDLGTKMAIKLEEQENLLNKYKHSGKALETLDVVREVLHKHGMYCWDDSELADNLEKVLSQSYPPELDRVKDAMNRSLERLNEICSARSGKDGDLHA